MDLKTEEITWKCDECGYEMTFLVVDDGTELAKRLCVCGVAGPKGNCKGTLILQENK